MTKQWEKFFSERHEQILSGKDISFDLVLLPEFKKFITHEKLLRSRTMMKVLDVGCGSGILINRLLMEGTEFTGVDPSMLAINKSLEYNSGKDNVKFINCAIENLSTDENFDCIISNMSLHAIRNFEAALQNINLLLKQDGHFLFSIPHPCFWVNYHKDLFDIDYSYEKIKKYMTPFVITNDHAPFPEKIPYYHRTISWYFSKFTTANLIVEKIIEPYPSKNIMKLYSSPWKEPHFLLFSGRKG